ncbi:MAG TPA: FmdE family protein [Planctomycetota bacterium]|nr:FmdE family protein [Planctomycetota bacterium]HRR79761.1 FmdE family protein [Planctomycetota bacterium]HRT96836.1 FmdE family protein [Planctomycetota bacterium]
MVNKRYPHDLDQVVRFHGHFCRGILIGYRAAKIGLEHLGKPRAVDEEIIAIVENDSCAVDAVQVLTGCTFGKGNLFFRDHGKHVYTFAVRPSGRAVRVSSKPGRRLPLDQMLAAPAGDLFWIEPTTIELPAPAALRDSVLCSRCGEPVMATRTRRRGDRLLCIPCAARGGAHGARPPVRNRPGRPPAHA